jgi:enterochelin esterase family protein
MSDAVAMKDALIAHGYDVYWNEWHEAHSWGNWRAHLDNTLKYFFPVTVAVHSAESAPAEFELCQNYPNPFNPTTAISYKLSAVSNVTLKVYDVLGREVATLVSEKQSPGTYAVQFDGSKLASGVYFYRLVALGNKGERFVSIRKLVVLK